MDKPTKILLDYNLIPHTMERTAHAKLWDSDMGTPDIHV